MSLLRRSLTLAVALACAALHTGCTGGAPSGEQPDSSGIRERRSDQINGAGATFPNPLYSKWFAEYNRIHPDVRINYQSLGSGAGIRQLTSGTVFFGATDQPVNDDLLSTAPGKILHFPTVLGAVVPIYNLEGVPQPLRFTGPLLADIILGRIRTWNDPAIVQHNTGVALPGTEITFIHRSEGSGTTFILADYLAKVSPEFKSVVGVDASLKWPIGVGGKGNEGVAALVRQTPGSLGYVELVYALQTRIAMGAVQNSSGAFVTASIDSVAAAATAAAGQMPRDFRVSITNAAGAGAYPIASFTWLLLHEEPRDKIQGRQMREFLRWALTDGQKLAPELGYARLPQPVVQMELKALDRLKVD